MTKNDFRELMSIGVDIGKDVFHLAAFNKEGQLDLQALHRFRSRLMSRRTATMNQNRAFQIEQGITDR